MKSPFPGMDPYLERHWLDVHESLVYLTKVAVQGQLSDDLVARGGERLIVEDPTERPRSQYPDVRVVEHGMSMDATRPQSNVALAEPLIMEVGDEALRQGYLEILDVRSGGRVITVIEFVSPTNKRPGDGQEKYRQKQNECVAGGVNLVEIDLTRKGERGLLVSPLELPVEYRTTYLACVFRATFKPHGRKEVYRLPLRERLPAIRIPLRASDRDVVLDIQSLIDQAYGVGRYDRTTDYSQPCDPPLSAGDDAWAEELLRAAGRR